MNQFTPLPIERQGQKISEFLPVGKAWDSATDGEKNLGKLLQALGMEMYRLEVAIELLSIELDINRTNQLIRDWEISVGIPDSCFDGAGDLESRSQAVLAKIQNVRLQTAGDFENLALTFGQVVKVTGGAEHGVFPLLFPILFFPTAKAARFTMIVDSESSREVFPLPFPLQFSSGVNGVIECLFTKLKPANCNILFRYTTPSESPSVIVSPPPAQAIGQTAVTSIEIINPPIVVLPPVAQAIGQTSVASIEISDPALTILDLDADDPSTIIASGDDVSEWHDKSGGGNDATELIAPSQQPKTGVNTINGLNTIAFDGVNDRLEFGASGNPNLDAFWATGGTIIFVSQSNSLGGGTLGRFFDKAFLWRVNIKSGGTGALSFTVSFSGSAGTFATPDNSFPLTPSIVTITYDASSVANLPTFYINGVAQLLGSVTPPVGTYSTNTLPLRIGGRHNSDRCAEADFGKIIFIDRVVSGPERIAEEQPLANKWGTPYTIT